MNSKTTAWIVMIAGVLLALVSLTADMIGVGMHPDSFGWKQLTGTAVGALLAVVGIVLLVRQK